MTIYTSLSENVVLPHCSIFSLVFGAPDRHAEDQSIFIDAPSGYTIRRGQFRGLALSLAHGITNFPSPEPPRAGLLSSILPAAKQRGLPLSQGQVALIFSPNSTAYPLVFFALQAAGVIATLANASYTPRELAHQLRDSNAEIAFVYPALLPVLEQAWKDLGVDTDSARRRTVVIDWAPWSPAQTATEPAPTEFVSLAKLLTLGRLEREVSFDGDRASSSTALMCYSSGTTGLAKGVETTHHNVTSVVTMIRSLLPWKKEEVSLSVLPLFHIFGVVLNMCYWPTFGVPVVVQAGQFTPDMFCSNIAKYRVTTSFVVPPILLAMAKHPAPTKHDITSLRNLTSGAAPLSDSLVNAVVTRLEGLGCKNFVITQGYGLTETTLGVFYLPESHAHRKVGSTGMLLPNLEVKLIEDGPGDKEVQEGEPGELWIRGPTIQKGYLNNPTATKEVLSKCGFFKTGDVVTRDSEGFYTIVDRKKELIKYKGFQVPPADLEAVLISHPEIADAAVIGVYSAEQVTELPRAYIVPAKGLQSFQTEEEKTAFENKITAWVATEVAHHKHLRGGVVIIDIVPKSPAGKILRRELRERYKKESGRDPVTGHPAETPAQQ
ncbi:AMP binding protein [Auriculariales sp. MPI-PUGE-AT-0066]|nr:AMP binding protein [Auriculariales sp. MPI-PUGE-AT-0066]